MRTNTEKHLEKVLETYLLELDAKTYKKAQHAACIASSEIHFGPGAFSCCDSRLIEKRYFASLNRVERFIESYLQDFYIDLDCDCLMTTEPEGYEDENGDWQEPFLENTYKVSRKECAKLIFGVCANYI